MRNAGLQGDLDEGPIEVELPAELAEFLGEDAAKIGKTLEQHVSDILNEMGQRWAALGGKWQHN